MYQSLFLKPETRWVIKMRGLQLQLVSIVEVQPFGLVVLSEREGSFLTWVALWDRMEALIKEDYADFHKLTLQIDQLLSE